MTVENVVDQIFKLVEWGFTDTNLELMPTSQRIKYWERLRKEMQEREAMQG